MPETYVDVYGIERKKDSWGDFVQASYASESSMKESKAPPVWRGLAVPAELAKVYFKEMIGFLKRNLYAEEKDPAEMMGLASIGMMGGGPGQVTSGPRWFSFGKKVLEEGGSKKFPIGENVKATTALKHLEKLGVSSDELDYTGLRKFLWEKGTEKVERKDLIRVLDEQGLEIETKTLGGDWSKGAQEEFASLTERSDALRTEQRVLQNRIRQYPGVSLEPTRERLGLVVREQNELHDRLLALKEKHEPQSAQYENYQSYNLPGGEEGTYREKLFKYEPKVSETPVDPIKLKALYSELETSGQAFKKSSRVLGETISSQFLSSRNVAARALELLPDLSVRTRNFLEHAASGDVDLARQIHGGASKIGLELWKSVDQELLFSDLPDLQKLFRLADERTIKDLTFSGAQKRLHIAQNPKPTFDSPHFAGESKNLAWWSRGHMREVEDKFLNVLRG